MRIVRTVGQAFEVCHKMQVNMPEQPVPSTSSAIDEPVPTERTSDVAASKGLMSTRNSVTKSIKTSSKLPRLLQFSFRAVTIAFVDGTKFNLTRFASFANVVAPEYGQGAFSPSRNRYSADADFSLFTQMCRPLS